MEGSEASRERRLATAVTASSPRPSRSRTRRSSRAMRAGSMAQLVEGLEFSVAEVAPDCLRLVQLPRLQFTNVEGG